MSHADLQRDAELDPDLADAVNTAIEERLKKLNTQCPGIIKAFDRTKLTATVQPVHEQLWLELDGSLTRVPLPLCTDVPVQFPGGGDAILTFDVSVGDECIIWFSQRCIDEWRQLGGTQAPGEHRFHDLSDGMASVGISSEPRAAGVVGGIAAGGAELRMRDGSVLVRVDSGGVTLGAFAGAAPVMLLTPDVITWLAAVGTGSSAGPPPIDLGATLVKGK